jgi:polyisoprenyl-teichoic acid--peptidoglycan teichoic acid transferase
LPDDTPTGNGLWKRFLLGAFLIVVAMAAGTSVAAFHEVHRVVQAFSVGPKLDLGKDLAEAASGKPQTIMLIGSDKRAKTARDYESGNGRSDTIILIRLDPSKKVTALLSIPRDLKVAIPGHGIGKINSAYTIGGAKLTLETVKSITGLRINHVINTDFSGFVDAVDQLGCVYLDIDRKYFNSGLGFDSYAAINLQPGYQRLCGRNALSFVRFRHTDSDIVRAARQQEFLSQMKQQVSIKKLFDNRAKLLSIFGQATRSDIRGEAAVIRLLKLALGSAGKPVQEIQFTGPGVNIAAVGPGGESYVSAPPSTIHALAREFLGVESIKSSSTSQTKKTTHRRGHKRSSAGNLGLLDATQAGHAQALQVVNGFASMKSSIPIFYPRKTPSNGGGFMGPPRAYYLRTKGLSKYAAYRIVAKAHDVGQYWGLQGLAWKNPPILKGNATVRHIRGRAYYIYTEGNVTRTIAWKTSRAVYWLQNTLSGELTPQQMLAIATSATSL